METIVNYAENYLSGINWNQIYEIYRANRKDASVLRFYYPALESKYKKVKAIIDILDIEKSPDKKSVDVIKLVIDAKKAEIEQAIKNNDKSLLEKLNFTQTDLKNYLTILYFDINQGMILLKNNFFMLEQGYNGEQIADYVDLIAKYMDIIILLHRWDVLTIIYDTSVATKYSSLGSPVILTIPVIIAIASVAVIAIIAFFIYNYQLHNQIRDTSEKFCEKYGESGQESYLKLCKELTNKMVIQEPASILTQTINTGLFYGVIGIGVYLSIVNGPEIIKNVKKSLEEWNK